VKPVFLLGCYGCIFHGTGNSAKLFQNFGFFFWGGGGGGLTPPTPGTPLGYFNGRLQHCPREMTLPKHLVVANLFLNRGRRFAGFHVVGQLLPDIAKECTASILRVLAHKHKIVGGTLFQSLENS
jgi:hypothetical protein